LFSSVLKICGSRILQPKQSDPHHWLGCNGAFSTNRLYCVFEIEKYVAARKSETNEKVYNVTCWEYIQ